MVFLNKCLVHAYTSHTACGMKHSAKCIAEKSYGIALFYKKGGFPYYKMTVIFREKKTIVPQGLCLTSRNAPIILVGLGLKAVKAGGP